MKWVLSIVVVAVIVGAGVFFTKMPEPIVISVVQTPDAPVQLAATEYAGTECKVTMRVSEGLRILTANGVPKHRVGLFSTDGAERKVQEQDYVVELPALPQKADHSTHVKLAGYTVAGVPFRPGTDVFYNGDRQLGWRYEALSGAVGIPMDENNASLGARGDYFYYGAPTQLLEEIGVSSNQHSGLVGWAMDGFPIYAYYGYADPMNMDGPIAKMTSSYQLKEGARPSDGRHPGGTYDGTFSADWKYVDGSGQLDNCNGRFTKTPEFPEGTYAYFLTESFPVVPRCLWGKLN